MYRHVPSFPLLTAASTSFVPYDAPERAFASSKYVSVAALYVLTENVDLGERTNRIPLVARVSITDYRGGTLIDTYVRPTHPAVDYGTSQTGIDAANLANAPLFQQVQRQVFTIIKDKIIVGHCLWKFLSAFGLRHPAIYTRDMVLYIPLRSKLGTKKLMSLSTLVRLFMGHKIGMGHEDSLEDARACIDLFRSCEDTFEGFILSGGWPCDLPPSSFEDYFL